ncbi:Pumilio domain-containing protein [Zancudomyces culisetae]|uniref:Pumilio domain-containing protein n=1 Tax=Zancudomyces culisetae TaxID=1213189 RepID=A0A1R1PNN3_ZANCU|nr:Pumilio domain-containing protein [Zancudomyces culisetae]|eukprot:OMH82568.1 Pumilio domain-containing protein [Zancudomyces culisetae]
MRLEDAMRAHDEMQGGMVGNCTVRVGYGRGEGYASSDAQAMQPTRALWVGNISPNTTAGSLRQLFEQFGAVESARILTQKNCGFVNFERLEDSVRAKQATNGKELDGMVLRIGYAKVPLKGVEGHHRLRNMIPTAPPLTMSGRIAEANAILGTSTVGLGNEDVLEPGVPAMDEQLVAFPYVTSLPPLPESRDLPFSQAKLREMRKRLDVQCPSGEFDAIFNESLHVLAELCTDYVGNMLVQRLAERATSAQKLAMISAVSRHIAAIGVHKNGTWAIQKLIDCCSSADQQSAIVDALRPFIPQLLLDQLGNYVVQCCLPFADGRNQFIFEAIHARCWEIAQGRFGARAIRTCLEHPNTSRSQQKLVAISLVLDSVSLATNPNGNILITWLLDISAFPGRFRVLAPQLACHLRHLCTHKLGSTSILKLIDQRQEPDARDLLLNTLFFNPEPQVLEDIVSDQVHGASLVLRILSCSNIDDIEKLRISVRVQASLQPLQKQGVQGYQKLADLVDSILISSNKLSLQPSISSSSSSSSSIPQADPISSITITLQNSDLYSSPSNNNGSTPDSFLPTSQSNNPTNQQYFSSSILSSSYFCKRKRISKELKMGLNQYFKTKTSRPPKTELKVAKLSDFHAHLRQGEVLQQLGKILQDESTATQLLYVMPNTQPPILTTRDAQRYYKEIKTAFGNGNRAEDIDVVMTLYFHQGLTEAEIVEAKQSGIVGGVKLYPMGVTTNSSLAGITVDWRREHYISEFIEKYHHVFVAMQREGLVLNIHGECCPISTTTTTTTTTSDDGNDNDNDDASLKDADVCVMDAELRFLPILVELSTRYPQLKIVMEHASSLQTIQTILELGNSENSENSDNSNGSNVACSITAHHLCLIVDDWLQNPNNFCKPVPKYPADRAALRKIIASKNPRFFLGSDSAPHLYTAKYPTFNPDPNPCDAALNTNCNSRAAGVFTTPILMPLLVSIFDALDILDCFDDFVSNFGRQFYSSVLSSPNYSHKNNNDNDNDNNTVTVIKSPTQIPNIYYLNQDDHNDKRGVIPFLAGSELPWSVKL